jgi:hypothetical protein
MTVMHQIKIRCDRCKLESVVIGTDSRSQARELAAYDHRWSYHVLHANGMWNDLCPSCAKEILHTKNHKEPFNAHQ